MPWNLPAGPFRPKGGGVRVTHPGQHRGKLIYDSVKAGGFNAAGFEDCLQFIPSEMFYGRNGSWTGADGSWIQLSGKMSVLARLLENLRRKTNDRIVLVSNYTQTLELFAQLCREKHYPYLKLDGTTSISKRQKLVQKFNDPMENEFVFLLSSKAGGCGLNLIGGNRLVLFDPDWNPANDKQAAARVWRDGQKKRVFIYRFLAAGTIEEKVFERQLSKEGLQKVVEHQEMDDSNPQVSWLSSEDLRDLFTLRENAQSNVHENLNCKRCPTSECSSPSHRIDMEEETDIGCFAGIAGCLDSQRPWEKQVGSPLEEELKSWAHHSHPRTVPDAILQSAAADEVSFVFTCQIDGKLVPIDSGRIDGHGESGDVGVSHGNQTEATRVGMKRVPGQTHLPWPSRKIGRLPSPLQKAFSPPAAAPAAGCPSPAAKTSAQESEDSDDGEFM